MPMVSQSLYTMAINTKENILLFGATGYIGAYILEQLIAAKGSFGRIAIFTSVVTAINKETLLGLYTAEGIEVIIGDVTKEEDIVSAFEGQYSQPTNFDYANILQDLIP